MTPRLLIRSFLLLLALTASLRMLQGCGKEEQDRQELAGNLFHVKKTDGRMIMGALIDEPEMYLISDNAASEDIYDVSVSFSGSESSYTDKLTSGGYLKINIPSSFFFNDGFRTCVTLLVRRPPSSEIIYRSSCDIAVHEIHSEVTKVFVASADGSLSSVDDAGTARLGIRDSGEIRVFCKEPVSLGYIDYSLGEGSVGLEVSGALSRSIVTEGGETFASIRYAVTGQSGSGKLMIHQKDRQDAVLYVVKYEIAGSGDLPGGDDRPPGGDDDPTPSKSVDFRVTLPSAVFTGKGFYVDVTLTSYDATKPLNARIAIDGEPVPMGSNDDDFFKFQYTLSDITPRKDIPLYVTGRCVDPGRHTLDVTLWEEGESREGGKTQSVSFNSDELLTRWYLSRNRSQVNQGTEEVLDAILTLSPSDKEFILEVSSLNQAAGIVDVGLNVESAGLSASREAGVRRWKVTPSRRGRYKLTYKVVTSDGRYYSWSASPYCYERYRTVVSVENNKLFLETIGPAATPTFSLSQTLFADIYAVIPYTEAVVEGGQYVNREKPEYHYISTLSKSHTYSRGGSFYKQELYSGIKTAVSMAKKQLSKYKASTNAASRWVLKNGSYTKESYTPQTFLLASSGIEWSTSGGDDMNFIEMEFDVTSLKNYLGSDATLKFTSERLY